MAQFSRKKIINLLKRGENASTTTEKGKALEDLICYIFSKVSGITVSRRNENNIFQSEEIDIAFWNEKYAKGFYFLPNIILVECKNWSNPVSSIEVSWFNEKLRGRGLDFGILIATNGITGNPNHFSSAHQIISNALAEKRQLIVIKRDEIEALVSTNDLILLIKAKLLDLAVKGTI